MSCLLSWNVCGLSTEKERHVEKKWSPDWARPINVDQLTAWKIAVVVVEDPAWC